MIDESKWEDGGQRGGRLEGWAIGRAYELQYAEVMYGGIAEDFVQMIFCGVVRPRTDQLSTFLRYGVVKEGGSSSRVVRRQR